MSDPTALAGDLREDLRAYFAMTTSTMLPRRVAQMSARTLVSARKPRAAWFAAAAGVVATAAVAVLVGTHALPQGGGSGSSLATANGAAGVAPQDRAPAPATISYPGVDTAVLAMHGVRLLLPAGHGAPVLTPLQAQGAAAAAAGAGTPGPAVLTFAELSDRSPVTSCLCWAVDVPVAAGPVQTSPGRPPQRTELVLVDGVSGRVVEAFSGNGVP